MIKIVVVLLTAFMSLSVVVLSSSCSVSTTTSPPSGGTRRPSPGGRTTDTDAKDDDDTKKRRKSSFCPSKVPEEDNKSDQCRSDSDCKSGCRDFFDDSEDECFELPQDEGNDMVEALEDLDDSKYSSLRDTKDMESLCLAAKIDEESWYKIIKSYSTNDARDALEWIADNNNVADLMLEIKDDVEDSTGLGIFKGLLGKARSSGSFNGDPDDVTEAHLLAGLKASSDEFLETAVKKKQDDLVKDIIHEELVKEELCDSSSNQPEPDTSGCGSSTCYTNDQRTEANDKKEQACELGVYCHILSGSSNEKVRRDLADILNDDDIEEFINDDKNEGGLDVDSDDDPDEWSDDVCEKLKDLWNNRSGGLNLGLPNR